VRRRRGRLRLDLDDGVTDLGEDADLDRAQRDAGVEDALANSEGGAEHEHVLSRLGVVLYKADLVVVDRLCLLEGNHGVSAFGKWCAGHQSRGGAGSDGSPRDAAGADFFDHLANFGPVAAHDGVTVHERFVVRRRVDGAGDVFGEQKFRRIFEGAAARREGASVLFDQLQRCFNGKHEDLPRRSRRIKTPNV
jgi:hypothetical protein